MPWFSLKHMPMWRVSGRSLDKLGDNKITVMGDRYIANQLNIYLTDSSGHKRSDILMKNVILHEIGHSYGLTGHSTDPADVMYESSFEVDKTTLSKRDINTIKALYAAKAACTNEPRCTVSQYGKGLAKDFNIGWLTAP